MHCLKAMPSQAHPHSRLHTTSLSPAFQGLLAFLLSPCPFPSLGFPSSYLNYFNSFLAWQVFLPVAAYILVALFLSNSSGHCPLLPFVSSCLPPGAVHSALSCLSALNRPLMSALTFAFVLFCLFVCLSKTSFSYFL